MDRRRGRRRRSRRLIGVGAGVLAAFVLAGLQLSGTAPWAPAPPPETAPAPTPTARPATELDPGLASAVQEAIEAAADAGVELYINSGWRSRTEQQLLWDEALVEYGSEQEAARWVLPPELSEHVRGLAVDVGPAQGAAWLAEHGARWGLCQVFANEPWHFEPATEPGGTCPGLVPDPTALVDLDVADDDALAAMRDPVTSPS